jgi:hypothetical protein
VAVAAAAFWEAGPNASNPKTAAEIANLNLLENFMVVVLSTARAESPINAYG